MIYSSFDDSIRRINPITIDIPAEKRTLESLIEKYSGMTISPTTAQMAMSERDAIVCECDVKGYHTVEDMQMIEYLWEIRNAVVRKILAEKECAEECSRIKSKWGVL
ncbi:MAG: hypothetical protein [Enterobacter phage ENC7]|nr:MAG: hypothetical protein [Enterobacter phage ENC7]UIW11775.1 MAG: hypothetical protein [Enterobacter phage ENC25]UIW12033.1 MAG: hypothetical protein [Enterobacter phage ENC22]UJB55288.1 hypothetical protein [Enterobacter phage vB_EcRAM-01]